MNSFEMFWSIRSNTTPDTKEMWTDTEKEHDDLLLFADRSDSGVTSPHSQNNIDDRNIISPCDLSLIDPVSTDEMKRRITLLSKRANIDEDDKTCLIQVINLINNLDALSNDSVANINNNNNNNNNCDDSYNFELIKSKFSEYNNNCQSTTSTTTSQRSTILSTSEKFNKNSRIVATVLPYSSNLSTPTDSPSRKYRSWTSSLQESGIFDGDNLEQYYCQSTQTEPEDFPCHENPSTKDLCAEIQKLNKFREEIEECVTKSTKNINNNNNNNNTVNNNNNNNNNSINNNKVPLPILSPNLSDQKRLQYYKDRLEVLEKKLIVYESSGDVQEKRLAERLQREIHLENLVKDLREKVEYLETENLQLEEEKCEFEEAENDTRLRLQRLEVDLEIYSQRNNELEMSREALQSKLKDTKNQCNILQTNIKDSQHKFGHLQDENKELNNRLSLIKMSMPAMLMFHTFMVSGNLNEQNQKCPNEKNVCICNESGNICQCDKYESSDSSSDCQCQIETGKKCECNGDGNSKDSSNDSSECECVGECVCKNDEISCESSDICVCAQFGDVCKCPISNMPDQDGQQQPEQQQQQEQQKGKEITKKGLDIDCEKILNSEPPCVCGLGRIEPNLQAQLIKFQNREKELNKNITELNRAYQETMENADCLWAQIEKDYKDKIELAASNDYNLKVKICQLEKRLSSDAQVAQERIAQLEECETELNCRYVKINKEHRDLLTEHNGMIEEYQTMKDDNIKMKKFIDGPSKDQIELEKCRIRNLQEELECLHKVLTDAQTSHEEELTTLKTQMNAMNKDLLQTKVTNSELIEEVCTLEKEICELNKQKSEDDDKLRCLVDEIRTKDEIITKLEKRIEGLESGRIPRKLTTCNPTPSLAQEMTTSSSSASPKRIKVAEIHDLKTASKQLGYAMNYLKTCGACQPNNSATNVAAEVKGLADTILGENPNRDSEILNSIEEEITNVMLEHHSKSLNSKIYCSVFCPIRR